MSKRQGQQGGQSSCYLKIMTLVTAKGSVRLGPGVDAQGRKMDKARDPETFLKNWVQAV